MKSKFHTRRSFIKTGLIFVPFYRIIERACIENLIAQPAQHYGAAGSIVPCGLSPGALAQVANWSSRIVAASGTAPNAAILAATACAYDELVAAGIDPTTGLTWNTFAPQGDATFKINTAKTPFIKNAGSDSWANTQFFDSNLTLDGLLGNAINRVLDTGGYCDEFWASPNSSGVSLMTISNEASNSNRVVFGVFNAAATGGVYGFTKQFAANFGFSLWTDASSFTPIATLGPGFYSASRTSSSSMKGYWGNNSNAVAEQASNTGTYTLSNFHDGTFVVFAVRAGSGTIFDYCDITLSSFALHTGFDLAKTTAFHNITKNLRNRYGGGTA